MAVPKITTSASALGHWLLAQLEHKLGRVFCATAGVALIVLAVAQPANREPFCSIAVTLGAGLVALGCLADRVLKFRAGSGAISLELEMQQETRVSTARIASEVAVEGQGALDEGDLEETTSYALADFAIRTLLNGEEGTLAGCDFHLYTYDRFSRRLLPVFETEDSVEPSEGWPTDRGVVGRVYTEQTTVIARGAECSDGTFGLSEEQQERYADLEQVVATPVFDGQRRVIAVLAGSTARPDAALATDDGATELEGLAAFVARVLVDVLKWFSDLPAGAASR